MNPFKHVINWLTFLAISVTAAQAETLNMSLSAGQAQKITPDYAKEQRWADQIVNSPIDGERVWLRANQQKFLGIYARATTQTAHGAVILLHAGGVHPDWKQVINPLRTNLPEKGWATLSIQMPVLAKGAEVREYVPLFKYVPERINAAVKYLKQKNIKYIVLAGHGLGASMGSHYLATTKNLDINAFVGISMNGLPQPEELIVLDNASSLLQITVPVLDIYAQYTNETVLGSRYRRAFALDVVDNRHSKQILISKSDNFFGGHEPELIEKMYNWMEDTLITANRN